MDGNAQSILPEWANVDEADPRTWRLPAGIVHVHLSCSAPQNTKIDKLITRMEKDAGWREVENIIVDYESTLQAVDFASRLPKLIGLNLCGKNLDDFRALAQVGSLAHLEIELEAPSRSLADVLPSLRLKSLGISVVRRRWLAEAVGHVRGLGNLTVYRWPDSDLGSLKQPISRYLTVSQSKITSTQGIPGEGVKDLVIAHCKRFKEFAPTKATCCTIERCPEVDYASLGQVAGLRSLKIDSQPPIRSVAGICECEALYELHMTGTRLQADDLESLAQLPELAFLWASPSLTAAQALRLSQAKHNLVVTNGDFCYKDGEVVDVQQAYIDEPRRDEDRKKKL